MSIIELPSVDPSAVASMPGAVLLDVREPQEWAAGHAAGAVHIPMSEVVARVGELDRSRRIIGVCRSGNRSSRVVAWLRDQGFDAVNLSGGMQRWASQGLPITTNTGGPGVVA
jgi:rhodanese-related sulfurtransferase